MDAGDAIKRMQQDAEVIKQNRSEVDALIATDDAFARGKAEGRWEAQQELRWILAVLLMRERNRTIRVAWEDVLKVPAEAAIEMRQGENIVEYRLRVTRAIKTVKTQKGTKITAVVMDKGRT